MTTTHTRADTAATTVAARAADLTKVYGRGETQVVALDGVTVEFRRGSMRTGDTEPASLPTLAALENITLPTDIAGRATP